MVMKMRDMMKRKNGQKGFTLVELIVVMAILAILAAIAVPKYSNVQQQAEEKAAVADCRTIASAVALHQASTSNAAAIPTVAQLGDYLTGATELGGKYTINYSTTTTGEIASITLTTAIGGNNKWIPGTSVLTK